MYIEPIERTERRNCIYKSQKTYEELREKIENNSNERELQAILKEDLSFFSFLASPFEEYICLPELKIGNKSVDFVFLTSRSSMLVYLIEIKGANFKTFNSNHYGSESYNITNANMQIKNHIEYIKKNRDSFNKYVHGIRDKIQNQSYNRKHLLGPKGKLLVDPNKSVRIESIIIGGREKDTYSYNEKVLQFLDGSTYHTHLYSWDSFLRRIDTEHGHYLDE